MSLLLQDLVFEVLSTTYTNLCEIVNTKLSEMSIEEKIKLEQDQKTIIEKFQEQGEIEVAVLQKRLLRLRREIFEYENNLDQVPSEMIKNDDQIETETISSNENIELLNIPMQFAKRNEELKQLSKNNQNLLRDKLAELKDEIDKIPI